MRAKDPSHGALAARDFSCALTFSSVPSCDASKALFYVASCDDVGASPLPLPVLGFLLQQLLVLAVHKLVLFSSTEAVVCAHICISVKS